MAVKKRSLFFFREQQVKKYHPAQKKVSDGVCVMILFKIGNCSVPSHLRAKMHLKSPSVMAFLLVCLGILA